MAVARLALTSLRDGAVRLSDEVELYQRTYTTLLRSSGETQLRVLEPSHRAMGSSLHPLAASDELDLGAFIYAIRRLPDGIVGARLVAMGQDVEALEASGMPVESWLEAEAPARRRRWYENGAGTLAVLLASASDVDDLVPTLVAFQIEWNKIRVRQRAAGWLAAAEATQPSPEVCARLLGGSPDDWQRLREAWGERFAERLRLMAERRLSLRVRMLGGTHTGYARMTRRWWAPVSASWPATGWQSGRKLGYHPILATRAQTGEVLHIRARKGSANTSRGALRFVEELIPRVARAGATGPKLLRADSGFWNRKLMARLQTAGWTYSIGVRQQQQIKAAITAIPEQDWQTLADYPAAEKRRSHRRCSATRA